MIRANKYWIIIISFFVISVGVQLNAQNKVLRAGAAQIDITPPIGTKIYGNWVQPSAVTIHDPLHAKALVLDDGLNKIVLVVVDLVEINKLITDLAKDIVFDEIGLKKENISISATHTHSGPSAQGDGFVEDYESLSEYSKELARKFADAIITAHHNLEPAMISWGAVDVPEHCFVRRWIMKDSVYSPYGHREIARMNPGFENPSLLKPSGPIDPEVSFISVQSTDGRPISVFANYSLHYVGGVPEDEISADYFGLFGRYMNQLLTKDARYPQFVGIMSNGTSGNVNNLDFSTASEHHPPYEKMNMVAKDIATRVYNEMETLDYKSWVPVDVRQSVLTLKVRRANPVDLANVARIQSRLDSEDHFYSRWEKMYANRILTMEATWPDSIDVILQGFRIGDLGIATLPVEAFTQTGLEIKSKSPFGDSFVIELANGCLNYLPTPEEIEWGGYETWLSINRVEKQASVKITKELLSLLESLKN